MPGKIGQKVLETRGKILSTARRLFESLSLSNVTMADIARAVPVARATLYRYFRTKKELFTVVVQAEKNYVANKLQLITRRKGNAVDKLKQYAHIHFDISRRLMKMHHLNRKTISRHLPEVSKSYQELIRSETELVGRILRGGVKKGELVIEDIGELAALLVSAVHGFQLLPILEPSGRNIHKDIDSLIDALIIGIGGKSSGKVLTGKT